MAKITNNKVPVVYYPRKVKRIFTKSSDGGIWEILHDSDKDEISLIKFKKHKNNFNQESAIEMNKKDFIELRKFFKVLKLGKNKTVNAKWMSKRLYEHRYGKK